MLFTAEAVFAVGLDRQNGNGQTNGTSDLRVLSVAARVEVASAGGGARRRCRRVHYLISKLSQVIERIPMYRIRSATYTPGSSFENGSLYILADVYFVVCACRKMSTISTISSYKYMYVYCRRTCTTLDNRSSQSLENMQTRQLRS